MAHAGGGTGVWRSVRGLPDRTSLRVKLITAVLALVLVALVIISVAGLSFLRSYLIGQADDQLNTLASQAQTLVFRPGPPQHFGPEAWVIEFVSHGQTQPLAGYLPAGSGPHISPGSSWLHGGRPVTVGAQTGSDRWRVRAYPNSNVNGSSGTIVVGLDVSGQYATLGRLTGADILVSVVILVVVAAVGTAVVRASLRPLNDIEETAGAIAAGDLTRRVPERDPRTEVGRLGRSLNTMLSQIETSFRARAQSEAAARRSEEKMRQFVADASHELRTPLTAIRGFAEYYRQRGGVTTGPGADESAEAPVADAHDFESGAGTGPEAGVAASDTGSGASGEQNGTGIRKGPLAGPDMDRIMRRVEQESTRMGVLVEDMLLLARMDQQRPLESRPVDLLTLAADAIHDARVVAPGRSINLTVDANRAPIVIGDEVRLRQVIGNLMSNALDHTPDGTPIDVLIRSGSLGEALSGTAMAQPAAPNPSHPAVVLEVSDHGPGLTGEQAEHVFERFYRADAHHRPGGAGLGLAIVAALTVGHGGAAWVQSRPAEGATFCIALPLSPDAVQSDEEEDCSSDGLAGEPYSLADDPYDLADDPYGLADEAADDQAADDQAGQDSAAQPGLGSAGHTRGNIV